ncbi:MAG TPA: 2-C-methyl-D-erythritol 4-phosphate cytidylyltransferase [Pirellulaceae bacterium]|nr:2-C-methyl-D-erythritol 4-phosphate cytidylyltransferase [Pirellulaceae bacterium]
MPKFAVILAAAGQSSRFKDPHYKKPFITLNQKAVWLYSAEKFLNRSDVKQLILVIAKDDQEDFNSRFGANRVVLDFDVVLGGAERCQSIENGLKHVREECDFICIHDAARPCLADEWIDRVFEVGTKTGAAILATSIDSTIKRSRDGQRIDETVPRDGLWLAQTPQVFRRSLLLEAFAQRGNFLPTDEAQLLERCGHPVSIVPGSPLNIKITSKGDLTLAAACLKSLPAPKFDAPLHPFADDQLWR